VTANPASRWLLLAMATVAYGLQLGIASSQDRVSITSAETRRCQNVMLNNPRLTALLVGAGTSIAAMCQCEARLLAGLLGPTEAADLVRRGALPKRLKTASDSAAEYCVSLQLDR
jgi:hypothetical protein